MHPQLKKARKLVNCVLEEQNIAPFMRRLKDYSFETYMHSVAVARYSVFLASLIGLEFKELQTMARAGLLHDIGKLRVNRAIVTKKGALTSKEYKQMRQHVLYGAKMMEDTQPKCVVEAIRNHHENVDGTGYVNRLKINKLNIYARILRIADSFDAMFNKRCYKPAYSKEIVLTELQKGKNTEFDAELVDIFIRYIRKENLQ